MDKKMLFYDVDDYYDFTESKLQEGYTITSITKFINKSSLIKDVEVSSEIIDLSALTEFNNIQSIGEQIIYQFEDLHVERPTFICDSSKRDKIEYELRFLFDKFDNVDVNSFERKKVEIKPVKENNKIKKVHRKIIDLSDEELNDFFKDFNKKLYGHPKFKDNFAEQIRIFRIFNKLKEHKILSFFLMGDSGVGKTEVARAIFSCLNGNNKFAKINFGNYSSEFSLSSLIGASRGYRDSEDGEIFMKVRDSDVGILLIDEFEKANTALFNYFLNVLETGIVEGSLGQQIDLNGFIIVFTSNIKKDDFSKIISPELRSRFDYKCMFTLLGDSDKRKYIEFRVHTISKKVKTEFGEDIENELKQFLLSEINVSAYNNMRDINKKIKRKFLEFITTFLSQEEDAVIEKHLQPGWKRKFVNLFNP